MNKLLLIGLALIFTNCGNDTNIKNEIIEEKRLNKEKIKIHEINRRI